jgi:uncharacterized protein (TIGR03435 family)
MSKSLLLLFTCAVLVPAQVPARPEFEVASIKPNRSGVSIARINPLAFTPGGRFTATNVTLVDLIVRFYPTRRIQMQGGPGWIDSDRFDVIAKAAESRRELKYEDFIPLVQALLEDRFKLALHREPKVVQVLALLIGKDPPKLQNSKEGEETAVRPGDRGVMSFQRMSIAGLVNTLSNVLHMPVIDQTGLKGSFNFTLDPGMGDAPNDADSPIRADSFGDLMIKAVQEQLGFKLEKQKAPLEITVIDHAEKPTEN